MTPNTRPPGAPGCWGAQYSDGDLECDQCSFRSSCAQHVLSRSIAAPARSYLPTYPGPPSPVPNRPIIPQPVFKPPVAVQHPIPIANFRPAPAAPPPAPVIQYQQYQQPAPTASIPDPFNPNPMVPMMRPGAPGPAYYFCQYPGESIGTRLAKNMVLRAGEAMLGEGMNFARHWTWPPKKYRGG
jgi:hypothetical protein